MLNWLEIYCLMVVFCISSSNHSAVFSAFSQMTHPTIWHFPVAHWTTACILCATSLKDVYFLGVIKGLHAIAPPLLPLRQVFEVRLWNSRLNLTFTAEWLRAAVFLFVLAFQPQRQSCEDWHISLRLMLLLLPFSQLVEELLLPNLSFYLLSPNHQQVSFAFISPWS